MDGIIALSARQRKTLWTIVRTHPLHTHRQRAHILLMLDLQITWAIISIALGTSASTIARWQKQFLAHGLAPFTADDPPRRRPVAAFWIALVVS